MGGNFKLAKEVNGKFSYVQAGVFDERASIEAIAHDAGGGLWIGVTEWPPNPAPKGHAIPRW